jgi:hypothetical protein
MDDSALSNQATEFLQSQVPGGQPATAQEPAMQPVSPTAAPGAAPAQASTGGRLLAGKYRSVEELERAALEKDRTLRERETELRAARAVNQHLEEVFAPLRQPREDPRTRPIPVTFDERQQPIIDPAALMQMVDERAREIAGQTVQDTLRPLSVLSQANNRLRADYPEIGQHEGEFTQWLQANPEMQDRVTKDPEFALEHAFLKFERERGFAVNTQNRETASAAQDQVTRARANASPGGGGPVASRRMSEQDAQVQQLNAFFKHGQETGDWKPYKNARTEMALGKGFTDLLERTSWGR